MPHKIVVFTGSCPLCNEVVDEIEAGKCAGCQLIVVNVAQNRALAKEHDIRVVPTVIINGEVKIEGKADIPFVCSDETYRHFKSRYPLIHKISQSNC